MRIREAAIFPAASGEGPADRVAVARCDQLDAVFRAAGGGDLQPGLRSYAGGVTPDCGTDSLRSDPVCGSERAEPGVGAVASRFRSLRAEDDAGAFGLALSGQGGGEFHLRERG